MSVFLYNTVIVKSTLFFKYSFTVCIFSNLNIRFKVYCLPCVSFVEGVNLQVIVANEMAQCGPLCWLSQKTL